RPPRSELRTTDDKPGSLVAVDDPPLREVVRRELDGDLVAGEDLDVVHPHLAREQPEDLVAVLELDAELRVGQGLDDLAVLSDRGLLSHVWLRGCSRGRRHRKRRWRSWSRYRAPRRRV